MKYGLKPEHIKIEAGHYRLGSNLPLTSINQSKDWEKYLPKYEPQAEKFETNGCVTWGGQNQIETYLNFLYGIEPNFAERYNYNLAETDPNSGADVQVVYDTFHNFGLINQEELPMTETIDEFITPRPVTDELIAKGKKLLEEYEIFHEWITTFNPEKIKDLIVDSLDKSPIALSVTAWYERDGLYIDNGQPNNHWCLCYGYRNTPEGVVLKIYDTYDSSKKELHPNHFVLGAKRIMIKKKIKPLKKSPFQKFLEWLREQLAIFNYFYKSHERMD